MTSKKAQGTKFENDCKKKLEEQGYVVIKSPRTMRCIGPGRWISQDSDYFNLFDLCAKKHNQTRWIQCKYGVDKTGVSHAKKPIQEFHDKYMGESETSEIWYKETGSRIIEIYQYDEETKEFFKREL